MPNIPPDQLPPAVELCARPREGVPCLGIVYRAQPDTAYCFQCGSTKPGVRYVRGDLAPRSSEESKGSPS